jgi:hypothetical protein
MYFKKSVFDHRCVSRTNGFVGSAASSGVQERGRGGSAEVDLLSVDGHRLLGEDGGALRLGHKELSSTRVCISAACSEDRDTNDVAHDRRDLIGTRQERGMTRVEPPHIACSLRHCLLREHRDGLVALADDIRGG